MNLKGKRFLITHSIIQGIMESTVVALELAEYLQSKGAKVTVYTSYFGNPAMKFFSEKKINVVGGTEEPRLNLEDYDYIWVHSQVLPFSFIEQLGQKIPKRMPVFIFNHMSALEEVSDEHPYIHGLEEALSSLSLFVSLETQKKQLPFYSKKLAFELYRNPAPMSYVNLRYAPRADLRKILIVSSHPPAELLEAKEILKKKGYTVESLGEKQEKDTLAKPKLLGQYDLIITIGKTVQYCLTAGIPVYVYDHFGGDGYLTEGNYQSIADRNYSGRNSKKKVANELVADILSGYGDAVKYQVKNRDAFIDELSIEKVLPDILNSIKPRKIEQFSVGFTKTMLSAQRFGNRFYKYWGWLKDVERYRDQLWSESVELRNDNEQLKKNIEVLNREKESLFNETQKLLNSKSYKLGRFVATPIITLKRVARRFRREK